MVEELEINTNKSPTTKAANKRRGRQIARFIAFCRLPDDQTGKELKNLALEKFVEQTGVDKKVVGSLKGSIRRVGEINIAALQPLLEDLKR